MTEKTQPPDADEDPAPLKHSDAERVTGTEAARSTPSEEQPPGHVPEDRN